MSRDYLHSDFLIVGGGIAALCLGLELLERQAGPVRLVAPMTSEGMSTWAAAGMLAPGAEIVADPDMPEAMKQALRQARLQWDLRKAVMSDGVLKDTGTAYSSDTPDWVSGKLEAAKREGFELTPDNRIARDAYVNPRQVHLELTEIYAARGGIITDDVIDDVQDGRTRGKAHHYSAGKIILACGLGAGAFGLKSLKGLLPVKGQMFAAKTRSGLSPRMIRTPKGYVVVHRPEHVIVGATSKPGDASRDRDADTDQLFQRILQSVFPDTVFEAKLGWVGHRPGTSDGLPLIGATEKRGIYALTGLYRHGILLSPWAARELADILLGAQASFPVDKFSPLRFV